MKKILHSKIKLILFSILIPAISFSSETDINGIWRISLQDGARTLIGDLEIEKEVSGWTGYLEGGPVDIKVFGDNNIEIIADSRDVRGFIFDRRMIGTFDENDMSGTYHQEGAVAQKEEPGPWKAVRKSNSVKQSEQSNPFDISGTWAATQQLDFRKYTMSLTEKGKNWLESYLPYYDQPDVRCASIGLPALITYSFPFEIIESEERYTMLYEYQSKVRRIWMKKDKPSKYMPPSRMGFSKGKWEGSTLVIKTNMLEKTIRDFRGELISENATIEERYSLSEDGQTLNAIIIVHDEENYKKTPIRRRQWVRNKATEIFPYTCDPDSFYIPMYQENKMQMYIDRSELRF